MERAEDRITRLVSSRLFRHFTVAALVASSLTERVLEFRDGGIGSISPQGEGWLVRPVITGEGIELQEISRTGNRQITCGEEKPLTPTSFHQFMYKSGLSWDRGFYLRRWASTEILSDPNNPCLPPAW